MLTQVKGFAIAAALLLAAGAAVAKPVIYDCKPADGQSDSAIQPQILISYDAVTGEVIVTDPLIMYKVGKPVVGAVQSDSDVRTVFDWRLKGVLGAKSKTAVLQYRLRYFKADGRLSLTVTPVGYDNHFSSEGRCTIQK